MVVASAKEPHYDSSMEDPMHPEWGKVVEPNVVPKGDDGLLMYNHIHADPVMGEGSGKKGSSQGKGRADDTGYCSPQG
eukprot:8163177-Karenia_brevis.AAC.1